MFNSRRPKDTGRRRDTRRFVTPLLAIALLGVAWLAWDRVAISPPEETRAPTPVGREPSDREVYFGPPNSIAVLPFAAPSADQAPQAFGFAGDVLARLVQIPELRVIARTSSFFFRDAAAPPRLVAERLQSAFLLRGEWREADGQVTLTASLYDARRDKETWREDYAGGLSELPALREAVIRDTLDALPGVGSKSMAGAGRPQSPAAFAPEAWLLLQQGLYQADPLTKSPPDPWSDANMLAAQASLRSALELDPACDAAKLALAELWLHPAWPADQDGAGVEGARRLAQQVLERETGRATAPDGDAQRTAAEARALRVLSFIRHRHDWDWQGALEAGRGAVKRRPGDAGLLAVASVALSTLAQFDEARELLAASVQRDPLNLGSRLRLGLLQEFSGLYDEALASYRQVLTSYPGYPAAHAYRTRVKALQDKGESALRESEQESDPFWKRYARILSLAAARRPGEAQALLEAMIAEDGAVAAFQIAELLAFQGETDRAFEWLRRALEQRDPGLSASLGNPLLQSLHDDPRWAEHLEQLGLPPAP